VSSTKNDVTNQGFVTGRPFGGVGFLWHSNSIELVKKDADGRCSVIKLKTNNRVLLLINIYPVLEYAAPAWRHLINRIQAQRLESVQKRAIHIIFNFTRGMSYPNVLFVAQLELLETRRNNLSRSYFKIFANQPPVFIILFHLPELHPLPLG